MIAKPLGHKSVALAAAACLLALSPAFAAEAVDQAGAQSLKQAIERYIGTKNIDTNTVSVSIKDSAYEVRIDPKSILSHLPKMFSLELSPITYRLKPIDDTRYAFTFNDDIKFTYAFDGPQGRVNAAAVMADCKSDGVYEDGVPGLSAMALRCDSYRVDRHSPDGDSDLTLKDFAIETTSNFSTHAGGFLHIVETASGFVDDLKSKTQNVPNMHVTAHGLALTIDSDGIRDRLIFDMLAEIGAQDGANGAPDQNKIKGMLADILPLWDNFQTKIKIDDLAFDMSGGTCRIRNISQDLALSGLTNKATATIGLGYDGIELPASVPNWVQKLVPTKGRIEFGVKDVDVDGLARLAIAKFDPASKPPIPPEAKDEFMKLLLAGAPHFLVNPSSLANGGIDVKFEGDMSLLPKQAGKFTVSAAGFEELRLALANSDMPNKDKTALAIAFIKGLAESGADGRLLWKVEFDTAGPKLKVNGQPIPIGPH